MWNRWSHFVQPRGCTPRKYVWLACIRRDYKTNGNHIYLQNLKRKKSKRKHRMRESDSTKQPYLNNLKNKPRNMLSCGPSNEKVGWPLYIWVFPKELKATPMFCPFFFFLYTLFSILFLFSSMPIFHYPFTPLTLPLFFTIESVWYQFQLLAFIFYVQIFKIILSSLFFFFLNSHFFNKKYFLWKTK